MRTLIVEDDPISRRLLERMLAPFGECSTAVNGSEAIEAFSQALTGENPFDLICLDIMMPEMDGQECLKRLRRIERELHVPSGSETKIVMTTALDSARSIMEAYYRGGCTAYLIKPIVKDKLFSTLREHRLIH